MPKIKTSSANNQNDSIKKLTESINQLRKAMEAEKAPSKNSTKKSEEDRRKKAEEGAKKKTAPEKEYEKARKALEEQRKEDAYQSRLNLAKNSANAIMPAERRQSFGSAAIGAIAGIDPAIVQMLGIDKLGANLWNSKFGFSAINKRHQQNRQEEKLNEKFGINNEIDTKTERLKGLNTSSITKKKEKVDANTVTNNNKTEKYGSVVNDKQENTKLLRELVRLNKEKKSDDGKIIKEDKKDSGGIFSKIFGVAKKLMLPMLIGILANAFRNHIKNAIAGLFDKVGMGDFGQFLGGALADFFPGAVGGLAYALKNKTPIIPSALIGGTISFAIPRIRRTIDQIMTAFSGDQDPNAGSLDRYAEKAMTGAMIGASIVGWKKGSLKAAALGAGIGLATEFVLARVNDIKSMLSGEPTEIKTIGGIPEPAFGGLVTGAMLGFRFGGGLKGAMIGALIGGGAGMIWSTVQDFRNQMIAAKSGKFVEPKEVFGMPYAVASGLIGGAAIGLKFGGFWPGLVIGALVGGLAGFIVNEIQKYKAKTAASEAQADKAISESEDFKQIDAQRAQDEEILNDPNASTSDKVAAQMRIANANKTTKDTKAQLAGFAKWDKNGDGILDENEQEDLDDAWFKSGNSMEMQTAMKEMRKKGIDVTKENLMKYNSDKLSQLQTATNNAFGLPTANMSTATQITENSEEQLDEQKKMNGYLEKISKAYDDPDNLPRSQTNVINGGNNQGSFSAYPSNITSAGLER